MKRYISFTIVIALLLTFVGCSKENPFGPGFDGPTGRLLTTGMKLSLSNEESVVRSASTPDVEDFIVDFIPEGKTTPVLSYKYSEMPEVVTLPVGSYTATAHYGENAPAAWEAPYYKGDSDTFEIKNDEITDNVEPIVCSLSNIKVTIILDDELREVMDEDAAVEVKVGNSGSLTYTLTHVLNGSCGFFAYVPDSRTLVATFNGKLEGYETHESKAYDNVKPGNHYRITFRLHSSNITDPGYINPLVNVDAVVEVVDMNVNVGIEDDILEDDMRPTESGNDKPEPKGDGPQIVPEAPVTFDKANDVTAGMNCVLNVTSEAAGGIQAFKVYIDSETLTEEVLKDVGLGTELDMVNPGAMEEGLRGLKFPVKEEVKGAKAVKFDITEFMPLLGIYGAATHRFTLEVTDANGTTKKTLILRTL